jgi:hypothetical protein
MGRVFGNGDRKGIGTETKDKASTTDVVCCVCNDEECE